MNFKSSFLISYNVIGVGTRGHRGHVPPKFSVCSIYVPYYKVIYYILCPPPHQSKSLSYTSECHAYLPLSSSPGMTISYFAMMLGRGEGSKM